MKISKALTIAALAAGATLLMIEPSLAADADAATKGWEQPAIKLINTLESGLVKIGAVIIGIGILALGMWAAITARLEWSKFGFVLIGGILVMAGPTMIKTLLEAVK